MVSVVLTGMVYVTLYLIFLMVSYGDIIKLVTYHTPVDRLMVLCWGSLYVLTRTNVGILILITC